MSPTIASRSAARAVRTPDRPAHEAVRSTASRKARTGPRPPASSTLTWSTPGSVTKRFGSGRGREQALAERDRDHPVAVAMDDEERAFELVDAVDRAVLIAQQPHRQVPVVMTGDIRRRGERRVEDEPGDRLLGREPHGDAGAERLAVEHEPLDRRPGGKPRVGGAGVDPQARFARRAGRARIAAIARRSGARARPRSGASRGRAGSGGCRRCRGNRGGWRARARRACTSRRCARRLRSSSVTSSKSGRPASRAPTFSRPAG